MVFLILVKRRGRMTIDLAPSGAHAPCCCAYAMVWLPQPTNSACHRKAPLGRWQFAVFPAVTAYGAADKETPLASPVLPSPDVGNAPATTRRRNRLALVSFLLSLAPFVLAGLAFFANAKLDQLANIEVAPEVNLAGAAGILDFLGGHIVFIGAVVTGGMALSRANRYPRGQAWRGFAIAGLVISGVGILLLCAVDAVVVLLNQACAGNC